MSEFEPNQNLEEIGLVETRETQGIALAKEIAALINEGTDEAEGSAIAKAQELEQLFAPQTNSEKEPELYSATELMLEDGSRVLARSENFSLLKDDKPVNLYPGNIFKISGVRVRFKGLVDSADPRTEDHGKPIIEIDIDSEGGLHQIVEPNIISETGEDFWSWEKLTPEEIEKQLAQWKTVYEALGLTDVVLPSKEALFAYLSDNPEFIELMQAKENQGFVKMVIAPMELKGIIDKLNAKVKTQGGTEPYLSDVWDAMLEDEGKIHYFSTVSSDKAEGGYTLDQIRANPEAFGVLSGCFVSFVESRQNIVKRDEADITDSSGRKAIKGGLKAQGYQDNYFSGADSHYRGEQAMLPQEWLGLFAADFHDKYLEGDRKMPSSGSVSDLMDSNTATWFTSTSTPGRGALPFAYWSSGDRNVGFYGSRPVDTGDYLAPRPSVRKSLKP